MSIADLDGDGDLDIVVNNLRTPAELLENRLCGGVSLQVDLLWPGSGNTRAIGSRLTRVDRHLPARDSQLQRRPLHPAGARRRHPAHGATLSGCSRSYSSSARWQLMKWSAIKSIQCGSQLPSA